MKPLSRGEFSEVANVRKFLSLATAVRSSQYHIAVIDHP